MEQSTALNYQGIKPERIDMDTRMQQLHTLVAGYRRINLFIGNLEADMQQNAMEVAFMMSRGVIPRLIMFITAAPASKQSIKDCFGTQKRIKQQRQEMSLLLDAARKRALSE